MRHGDTTLWLVQVATGFGLLFLAPVHLYGMLSHPDLIGPYASADRVWSGHMWPLYLALLLLVEVHAGVGLYRLAVKWIGLDLTRRRRLKAVKWGLTVAFLALGLVTLGAYIRLGMWHAPDAGERYVPTWQQEAG
jgi:fumarate reductase subunit C